jgi:hypothetical protein
MYIVVFLAPAFFIPFFIGESQYLFFQHADIMAADLSEVAFEVHRYGSMSLKLIG